MAESIKLSVKSDKSSIFLFDDTGEFDSTCNSGGWGSPNLETNQVDTATVSILPPKATVPIVIDLKPTFPNTDCLGFEVLASDLGFTEIPSGVWSFTYNVTTPLISFDESFTLVSYIDDNIACCIDNLLVDTDASNILSESNKNVVEMESLLENARWAAEKGDITGAQTIADYLTLQCKCLK